MGRLRKWGDNLISYPLLKELWKDIKYHLDNDIKKKWIKSVAELRNNNSSTFKTLPKVKWLNTISVSLRTWACLNAMNLSDEFKWTIDRWLAHIFKKHWYNPQIEMNQRERASFVEDLLSYCRKIFPDSLRFLYVIEVPAIFKLTINKSLARIFNKHWYHPKLKKSQEEYVALIEDIVFYCRETAKYKVIDYPDTSLWWTFTFNVDWIKVPITHTYELLPDKNGVYHFELYRKWTSVIDMNTLWLQRYRYRGNDSVPNIKYI